MYFKFGLWLKIIKQEWLDFCMPIYGFSNINKIRLFGLKWNFETLSSSKYPVLSNCDAQLLIESTCNDDVWWFI